MENNCRRLRLQERPMAYIITLCTARKFYSFLTHPNAVNATAYCIGYSLYTEKPLVLHIMSLWTLIYPKTDTPIGICSHLYGYCRLNKTHKIMWPLDSSPLS